MDKSKKRHISYEALTLLGVIMLLCFITRLWPILLLALVGAIIAAIALLFVSLRKPETVAPAPPLPPPPMPENEGDLVRMAFMILERRITEAVLCQHPRRDGYGRRKIPKKPCLWASRFLSFSIMQADSAERRSLLRIFSLWACVTIRPCPQTRGMKQANR